VDTRLPEAEETIGSRGSTKHIVSRKSQTPSESISILLYSPSFIDLERGGFGEILLEMLVFSERLCPEGSIITEDIFSKIVESPEHRVYK
jgi:hypothetical protein